MEGIDMNKFLAAVGSWAITMALAIAAMWYTNHITMLCNKAGCIITLM